MLKKVSAWRHVVAGAAIVGTTLLAGFGVIGAGDQGLLRGEHFDAKQILISPIGEDGVRIREVVDIDFGVNERRGYQRIVPNDFGAPTDIDATSPDANAEVTTVDFGSETRIRLGDPDLTFTGQRRYILEYTLPAARVSTGVLALDVIGNDETFQTDRFEVVLDGWDLDETRCDVGAFGALGGCELDELDDGRYRVVFEPLDPGEGITVGGTIVMTSEQTITPIPEPPARNPSGFRPLGLVVFPLGVLTAAGVYAIARRVGSNEVRGAGGAADAAFGDLPTPQKGDPLADVPTHRVPDSRLAELATIEFAPPRGLEPWHGNVLLRERVDDQAVSAWFSEMVARGAIVLEGEDDDLTLYPGQTSARLNSVDRAHLAQLFRAAPAVELGAYDKDFTSVWKRIRGEQRRLVDESGWWSRPIAGWHGPSLRRSVPIVIMILVFLAFGGAFATIVAAIFGGLGNPISAVAVSILAVALVSFLVYRTMLPSRTATGSALTLRTESFRRFLEGSEGRHVDWAWERGVVREYSAWAVALGAADAWSRAIEASNIPDRDVARRGPLLIHTYSGSFASAHTPPSSSGGGGGGFGGGGVGGGGGGGSSGSW